MSSSDAARDPFREDIPAYALDALDPDETTALEQHLAGCPSCQAELASFQMAVAGLALNLDEEAEPAGHRERFLQKLAGESPLPAAPATEPAGHRERFLQKLDVESGPGPAPAPPSHDGIPAPRTVPAAPARRWWEALLPWAGWGLAGAFALLFVVAGLWGLDAQERADAARAQVQTLTAQADAARAQVQTLTAQQARLLTTILVNPNARSIALSATGSGPAAARVQIWVDPGSGQAFLAASSLPPAPSGKVYELWLLQGQTAVPITVFPGQAGGTSILPFTLPGPVTRYAAAAITVEAGKVPKPTTPPILSGRL